MTFLKSDAAIERLDTSWGPVWQVRRYHDVKRLLADENFQQIRPTSAINMALADGRFEEASHLRDQLDDPSGTTMIAENDPANATDPDGEGRALRLQVMTAVAAPHNVRRRTAEIETLAAGLARAYAATPDTSASEHYSAPLAARAMCVLLGVSADESADFVVYAGTRTPVAGVSRLAARVRGLIQQRRREPQPDVVSDLLAKGDGGNRQVARLTNVMTWALMGSNWEVPAAVIDFGTGQLLTDPGQLRRLTADPALLPTAVEEILRLFKSSEVARGGLVRFAVGNAEIAGVAVRAGDIVLADVATANRDGRVFTDPEQFDVGRQPNPHLTFGHGSHMCRFIGMSRVLITTGLTALLAALPEARPIPAPPGPVREGSPLSGQFEDLWLSW